ncbi:MAG: hypothetical protein LIR50_05430 [Bacillota bacterium]|nr:hypothetical protein [Bacillota bacterium]
MANHAILIQSDVLAKDNDSLNKNVVATVDIDNGFIFNIGAIATGRMKDEEVYTVSAPLADGTDKLYMAYEPELPQLRIGDEIFKGVDINVKNFTNYAGDEFTGFKLTDGDLIRISLDGIEGTYNDTMKYAIPQAGKYNLAFSADKPVTGSYFEVLKKTFISIGASFPSTGRVDAFKLRFVA